jgi:hypothetical protein
MDVATVLAELSVVTKMVRHLVNALMPTVSAQMNGSTLSMASVRTVLEVKIRIQRRLVVNIVLQELFEEIPLVFL